MDVTQAEVREMFLRILDKSGLRRSEGGTAILLTGRDSTEHCKIDDIIAMSLSDLARLYTVRRT